MDERVARSGRERLADCLGSDHHLRMFEAALADAYEAGGPVHVIADAIPGSGRLLKAPLILNGRRPW